MQDVTQWGSDYISQVYDGLVDGEANLQAALAHLANIYQIISKSVPSHA